MSRRAARLALPVDSERDHIQGADSASVTLVEYGDYACRYCRQVMPIIRRLQEELGDRLTYVFRHFPNRSTHPMAQLAAEAAEAAGAQGRFWEMHDYLLGRERVESLTLDDLLGQAETLGLDVERFRHDLETHAYADRVREDLTSGMQSGANGTPTFFINGRRYDGAWDFTSLREAIEKPLGVRVQMLFGEFSRIEAAGGILLLLAAIIALVWANSPLADVYFGLLETELVFRLGSYQIGHSLQEWINDGLMVIFFFVVGLEIKREVLAGELSRPRQAILPIAAALGGMMLPALIYEVFNLGGVGQAGWGIPIATDIAFMLGVLAVLGSRVPVSLKVFFTALAIADDLGAVLVIALFYSEGIHWEPLAVAGGITLALLLMNRVRVSAPLPYVLLGIALWAAFLESGVHPTIAGVLLAMMIPARSAADTSAFVAQANRILTEIDRPGQVGALGSNGGRRQAAVQTLETIVERIESPLQRLERSLHPWTTYVIIPIFALANAGVSFRGDFAAALLSPISIGIFSGLVVGKTIGISLFSWLVVRLGLAELPDGVDWWHLFSASWLAGIGFTMSLFIATTEFTGPRQLVAAKVGIIFASLFAGVIGTIMVLVTSRQRKERAEQQDLELPTPAPHA